MEKISKENHRKMQDGFLFAGIGFALLSGIVFNINEPLAHGILSISALILVCIIVEGLIYTEQNK